MKLATGEISWSEEAAAIFGYDPNLAATLDMLVQRHHPDDRERARHDLEDIARTRQGWRTERRLLMDDGSVKNVYVVAHPIIRERDVEIVGAVGDLTRRRRAEAAEGLLAAHERLELALRGSKVGMWDFDLSSTGGSIRGAPVSWVNLWEALGYEPELPGPVGRSPRLHPERWHPDDRAPVLAALEAYLAGEAKEFGMEWRLIHRDGSAQWRLSRGVAVRDATGRPTRFIGTSVDITDRKALEEQLLQAKDAAEAASKAKDSFLANVSHEIRTPMNAILGMTEMVLDSPLTDEQRRALGTVKSAADNLLLI
ncbi:MAG TPA: PAS domain-containing protein, partial [Polyangia bacterium]|nr:PAS domain-containing protein [Polyangia bacterium]